VQCSYLITQLHSYKVPVTQLPDYAVHGYAVTDCTVTQLLITVHSYAVTQLLVQLRSAQLHGAQLRSYTVADCTVTPVAWLRSALQNAQGTPNAPNANANTQSTQIHRTQCTITQYTIARYTVTVTNYTVTQCVTRGELHELHELHSYTVHSTQYTQCTVTWYAIAVTHGCTIARYTSARCSTQLRYTIAQLHSTQLQLHNCTVHAVHGTQLITDCTDLRDLHSYAVTQLRSY
jgi:hypothetical protein